MAAVVCRKARVAAMTVIVQAVMIGEQVVVVAQQANPPMAIAVKHGQQVLAVLRAAVAQTLTVVQIEMPVQIVIAASRGAMIKLAQLAAASRHLVTSQLAAASRHLAASLPLTNVQILVISQRRKSHHPAAAIVVENAHRPRQRSASAHRGQAVMPHRRAAKAH